VAPLQPALDRRERHAENLGNLGVSRSTAANVFNLKSFEYEFMAVVSYEIIAHATRYQGT